MNTDYKLDISEDRAKLARRAAAVAPGGVQSNARLLVPEMFFSHGKGGWIWDTDGKRYADYLLGRGPAYLGHAPDDVLEAVAKACERGLAYGAQHELEVVVAEKMIDILGWPELIRFESSGTEGDQLALRVARGATGRSHVVQFARHYHGWLDSVWLGSDGMGGALDTLGQAPHAGSDTFVLPWNNAGALQHLVDTRGDQIAAVIMEPVAFNYGGMIPAPDYLAEVRRITAEAGIALVFDEVITGFRLHRGGAAALFGVTPDLAVYAKALASGWPVAAVAGRADWMSMIGTNEIPHGGTLNGNVASMAAIEATLRAIETGVPERVTTKLGGALMAGIQELSDELGLNLWVRGFPAAFIVHQVTETPLNDWDDRDIIDRDWARDIAIELIPEGVWTSSEGLWFVSAAHTEEHISLTLEAFRKAATRIRDAG